MESTYADEKSINWVMFCGGTGMHNFFDAVLTTKNLPSQQSSYSFPSRIFLVSPISDDGGSSRALIDYFGGPALGDARNMMLNIASSVWAQVEFGSILLQTKLIHVSLSQRLAKRFREEIIDSILRRRFATGDSLPRGIEELNDLLLTLEAPAEASDDVGCFLAVFKKKALCALQLFSKQASDIAAIRRKLKLAENSAEFDLRGASVGNLILHALVMEHVRERRESPITAAIKIFLNEFCGIAASEKARPAEQLSPGDLSGFDFRGVDLPFQLDIIPAFELHRGGEVHGISQQVECSDALLPRVSLHVALKNGDVFDGQLAFAYGAVDDSRIVNKSAVWTALTSQVVRIEFADKNHSACARDLTLVSNERYLENLLGYKRHVLVLFCRGSLITSLLASCIPFLRLLKLLSSPRDDGQRVNFALMVNSTLDRESSACSSLSDYVSLFEDLIDTSKDRNPPMQLTDVFVVSGSFFDAGVDSFMLSRSVPTHVWRVPSAPNKPFFDDTSLVRQLCCSVFTAGNEIYSCS